MKLGFLKISFIALAFIFAATAHSTPRSRIRDWDCKFALEVYPEAPKDFTEQSPWKRTKQWVKWYFEKDEAKKPVFAQSAKFFIENTPEIFLKRRPLDPLLTEKEIKHIAKEMSQDDAETLYSYLVKKHMFSATTNEVAEQLKWRWPQGLKWKGLFTKGPLEIRRNVTEAFELLAAYDRIHRTQFTPEVGFVILRNYKWDVDPALQHNLWALVADRVIQISNDASDPDNKKAISRFFNVLRYSPNAESFYQNPRMFRYLAQMLQIVHVFQAIDAPDLTDVRETILKAIEAKTVMTKNAQSPDEVRRHLEDINLLELRIRTVLGDALTFPVN